VLELVKEFVGKHNEVQQQSRSLNTENANGKQGAFASKNLETTAGIGLFLRTPCTAPRLYVRLLHRSGDILAITVKVLVSDPCAAAV
jgi:hypothetical protein